MKRQAVIDERFDSNDSRKHVESRGEESTTLVDLSPYYGYLPCFRDVRPLRVMSNRFTYAPSYPPRETMQNTWLSIALEGIARLFSHCSSLHYS